MVPGSVSNNSDRQLNILAVAYVFPPDAGSGTFRSLYFTKYWAAAGDTVTVLTVQQRCFAPGALIDSNLCRAVAPAIHVERAFAARPLEIAHGFRASLRARAAAVNQDAPANVAGVDTHRSGSIQRLKDAITGLLGFPDEHVGWIPDAVRRGYRLIKERRIDCVYATGGPWSGLIAAALLRRLSGCPLVLDFRDPWVSNPNMRLKSRLSRWAHARLESFCVHAAVAVIANTDELRADFATRYRSVESSRFITITNGFEDLPPDPSPANDKFTLVHAGALYLSRSPLHLLVAIRQLLAEGAIPEGAMDVRLIGGAPDDDPAAVVELRSHPVRHAVHILPRVPHGEALALQREASALLLIQTGFPLQIPRKLYEYLALRRPILAIAEPHSATARMVIQLNAGVVTADTVHGIKAAILALYRQWRSGDAAMITPPLPEDLRNARLAATLRNVLLESSLPR